MPGIFRQSKKEYIEETSLFQEAWNAATLLSEESIGPILQELGKRRWIDVQHD
jgi:hypothetical protein